MSEIPGEAGARNPPLMANRVEARVKMKSDASIRQTNNKTFDGCFQVCASIQLDHLP